MERQKNFKGFSIGIILFLLAATASFSTACVLEKFQNILVTINMGEESAQLALIVFGIIFALIAVKKFLL